MGVLLEGGEEIFSGRLKHGLRSNLEENEEVLAELEHALEGLCPRSVTKYMATSVGGKGRRGPTAQEGHLEALLRTSRYPRRRRWFRRRRTYKEPMHLDTGYVADMLAEGRTIRSDTGNSRASLTVRRYGNGIVTVGLYCEGTWGPGRHAHKRGHRSHQSGFHAVEILYLLEGCTPAQDQ